MSIESAALKIAFCGEISSGKSTALQTILRTALIPDFFGYETRPTIRIVLGAKEKASGYFTADGEFTAIESFDEIDDPEENVTELVMALTDTYGLGRACELVEISPFRDGHVENGQIAKAAECTVMVWTTIGSQAWRLSEKTILDEFGSLLPEQRILVATRADKFRSEDDLAKIEQRLERETADYFEHGQLLGVPPSLFSKPEDDAAWTAAGATEFVTRLAEILSNEPDTLLLGPEAEVLPAATKLRRRTSDRSLTRVNQALQRRVSESQPVEAEDADTSDLVSQQQDAEDDTTQTDVADIVVLEDVFEAEVPEGPSEPEDPVAALIASTKGLVAIGIVKPEQGDTIEQIYGDSETVETFGKFCLASSEARQKLVDLDDNPDFADNMQVVTDKHSLLFQTNDTSILFLVGDASHLTAGIARTLLTRLVSLYEADELVAPEAA